MNGNHLAKAFDEIREDLTTVERRAKDISGRLRARCSTLESLKIDILKSKLMKERRDVARLRGITALRQDTRKLGIGLGLGVAGLIFGGVLTKNKYSAASTGLRSVDTFTQGLGQSRWAVSLDSKMLVVPRDEVTAGRSWVTLDSLSGAMERLREKALAGEKIGDLQAIVSALEQDHQTLRHLLPPAAEATEWVRQSDSTSQLH